MSDSKKNILTKTGLEGYEEELSYLKEVERIKIAERIKEAREQGDLSENAEYHAAKDKSKEIENRIAELENILKNVEVIDESEVDLDTINIGCKIKLLDMEFDEELEYKIVGSMEADSLEGKISNESPVGAALIGHKIGDIVVVETQVGEISYKVLDIHNRGEKAK